MKCSECGGKMASRRENYLFSAESGLPVTLAGVEVRTCAACGSREAVVPAFDGLNSAMASVLARKPGRLSGSEFRYLRSFLGLSGRDLARLLGASPATVSRWEQEAAPVGTQVDKLMRVLAARHANDQKYWLPEIEAAAAGESAAPLRFTMTWASGAWKVAEAGGRKKVA